MASELLDGGVASRLVGVKLLDTWTVTDRVRRDAGDTGQSRSVCYRAVDAHGHATFVKAFDFRHEDVSGTTDRLEAMLREFNHERDVHFLCRDRRLGRVTQILAAGKVVVDGLPVHFIVCECAGGSLRELEPPGASVVPAHERLARMRDVAAGLMQLHAAGVAHQDLKPSNVVRFADGRLKITDLGSSSCLHLPAPPHDLEIMVGQPSYAPYELLYSQPASQWNDRRFGCDLFLLGNLLFTTFVGASVTVGVMHAAGEAVQPCRWERGYAEVVPFLRSAHHFLVPELLPHVTPPSVSEDVVRLVLRLCDPDPSRRSNFIGANGVSTTNELERLVSRFDLLSKRAKVRQ